MSSSDFVCYLCPGGASPINPSTLVYFTDGSSYSCSVLSDALPNLSNDTISCLQVQYIATPLCCAETFASVCNPYNDTCPLTGDGLCHNIQTPLDPNQLCVNSLSDCLDCDPCSVYHYTSCDNCTSAYVGGSSSCYWCPGDGLCFSQPFSDPYPDPLITMSSSCSSSSSDWVTSCESIPANVYSDPYYNNDAWAFKMINIESVWEQNITGLGVGIRINDIGVDNTHPEFEGKFDINASCPIYLPSVQDDPKEVFHGTACASIATAKGNNDVCAVGIAPDATLSACKFIGVDSLYEYPVYLIYALDYQDVSSNSFGQNECESKFTSSTSTTTDDGGNNNAWHERFLQQDSAGGDCPFQMIDSTSPPCSECDFTNLDETCILSIASYCSNPLNYNLDYRACVQYLELFATCHFNGLTPSYQYTFSKAIQDGRNGKGLILVFASGNENQYGSNANYKGTCNSRFTITVGAVGKDGKHASYSNSGACLFVSGPGGDLQYSDNWITAQPGDLCQDSGEGTSFATPVVSGVIALMLQVNPDLTWRDVQGILAKTSQVWDTSTEAGWVTNAGGYSHSYQYGFGVVDAAAAVDAASTWNNIGPEVMLSASSGIINSPIADSSNSTTTSTVTVDGSMTLESVVVYLKLDYTSRGHLKIVLTSPDGTESVLSPGMRPEDAQLPTRQFWKLLTLRSYGESSQGDWTLSITDTEPGDVSQNTDCVDLPLDDDYAYVNGVDCSSILQNLAKYSNDSALVDQICTELNGTSTSCCFCGGGESRSQVQNQLVSWAIVLYGHDLVGTSQPTVSPAPTVASPLLCFQQQEDLTQCFNGVSGGSSCTACIIGSNDQYYGCDSLQSKICQGISNCGSCANCGTEFVSLVQCNSGCNFACDSSAADFPTVSPVVSSPATSPSPVAPVVSPSAASPVASSPASPSVPPANADTSPEPTRPPSTSLPDNSGNDNSNSSTSTDTSMATMANGTWKMLLLLGMLPTLQIVALLEVW